MRRVQSSRRHLTNYFVNKAGYDRASIERLSKGEFQRFAEQELSGANDEPEEGSDEWREHTINRLMDDYRQKFGEDGGSEAHEDALRSSPHAALAALAKRVLRDDDDHEDHAERRRGPRAVLFADDDDDQGDDDDSENENRIEPMSEDEVSDLGPEETKNVAKKMRDALKASHFGEDELKQDGSSSDSDVLAKHSDKDIDTSYNASPDTFKKMLVGAMAEQGLLTPPKSEDEDDSDDDRPALGKADDQEREAFSERPLHLHVFSEKATQDDVAEYTPVLTNTKTPLRYRQELFSDLQRAGLIRPDQRLIR